jgi:hypothetical protein
MTRFQIWADRQVTLVGATAGDEQGVEVVEGIGMFILLLMTGLIIWQFMIVGHQMVVVGDAARHGARAAAAHRSCGAAVQLAVSPQNLRTVPSCNSCSGQGAPVEARVTLFTPTVYLPSASGAWRRIGLGWIWFNTRSVFRCEPE